jgi:TonB family protein
VRDDHKAAFTVWQIGAGIVILALLVALSWHHLRPHSHSEEENGAGVANSPQAATEQSQPVAAGAQNAGSAHREADGSTSGSGGAASGSGERGGSDATEAKRKNGARDNKNRDVASGGTSSGSAGGGGTTSATVNTGAGASGNTGTAASVAPSSSGDGSGAGAATAESPTNAGAAAPLRVNATVQDAKLVRRVSPVYPTQAVQNHISGMVVLDVVIAKDGTVKSVTVTSGDPALAGSAMDAVKQRRYEPTLVNGQTVEVETTVSVDFAIKNAGALAGATGATSASTTNGPPTTIAVPSSNLSSSGSVSNAASSNASANAKSAACSLGNVAFQENGAMIVGTVPFTYSGSAKLATLAVVGFPAGADKKRIAGVKLAETTLQSPSGNASFSMESHPSLSGGGTTGEFVEVVVIVKSTGDALCGKLVPYLRNW